MLPQLWAGTITEMVGLISVTAVTAKGISNEHPAYAGVTRAIVPISQPHGAARSELENMQYFVPGHHSFKSNLISLTIFSNFLTH